MRLPSATSISLDPSQATPRSKIEKAAQELEAQFAHMLVKTMRSASMGDSMLGDNTTYREMYDQQLSREITKGRGLGLTPTIVRQLERSMQPQAPAATSGPLPLSRPAASLPLSQAASPLSMASRNASLDLTLPTSLTGVGTLPLSPSSSGVSMPTFSPLMPRTALEATAQAEDCDPNAKLDCSSPEAFVRSIWPHAKKTAEELGVPAKALVAQAALETGWGRKLVGHDRNISSHNLFGIKATGWKGDKVSSGTHEYVNGVRQNQRADFRAYASAADSFADYARLLKGQRYADARGAGEDTHRFASALQKAGYATDPAYASKISAIANGPTLNRALAALRG